VPLKIESKLALIIPVYNEASSVIETIHQVTSFARELHPDVKVYFVDDGSTDESLDLLKSNISGECRIIALKQNRGYGEALRKGAKAAHSDGYQYCVFLDSDLTNPLADIPGLIQLLVEFDCVKASRYVKGASVTQVPWKRRAISRVANVVFRYLFRTSIKDVSNGFRAWKLAEFVKLPGTSQGFDSIVEEFYLARVKSLKIGEAPTHLGNRNIMHRPTAASYTLSAIVRYLRWPIKYFLHSLFSQKKGEMRHG
jgi:dolichol-phosphate mannosyltransferase